MKLTRRSFLRGAGTGSLMMAASCNVSLPWQLPNPFDDATAVQSVPETDRVDEVSHVLSRLSYGARPTDYARVRAMGSEAYLQEQLAPETIDDAYCDVLVRRIESIHAPTGELFEYKEHYLREQITRATLLRATYSERQLYEQMVGFWTDHFNIALSKGDCPWLKIADDRDTIRKHALGTFSDLLTASALSPAMLWYLDGRVNRTFQSGDKPNENYARELLELHTLGVDGGYTQKDVMEAARCLTGWTVRSGVLFGRGQVEFDAAAHDDGDKEVLGHSIPAGGGERDIHDLLDIVARHPATARYIATKLCRRFIADSPDETAVRDVAETFTSTEGDIKAVLATLFRTAAFRAAKSTKFKRPFRFVVSALRAVQAETQASEPLLIYLDRMGHAPFQFPTPDGFPEGLDAWSGTLLWRWHFASALSQERIEGVRVKWNKLEGRFGTRDDLLAHLVARRPTSEEVHLTKASPLGPALLMAGPAFQLY